MSIRARGSSTQGMRGCGKHKKRRQANTRLKVKQGKQCKEGEQGKQGKHTPAIKGSVTGDSISQYGMVMICRSNKRSST
jgi:hypothetical protein